MKSFFIGVALTVAIVVGYIGGRLLSPPTVLPVEIDTLIVTLPPDTVWKSAERLVIKTDTCWLVKIEKDTVIDTVYVEAHKGDEYAKASLYIDTPCSLGVHYWFKNDLFSFTKFARQKISIRETVTVKPPFARFYADVYLGEVSADWRVGLGISAVFRDKFRASVMTTTDSWLVGAGMRIGK